MWFKIAEKPPFLPYFSTFAPVKTITKNLSLLIFVMCIAFQCHHSSHAQAAQFSFFKDEFGTKNAPLPVVHTPIFDSLDKYFEMRHKFGHFNGTVLIAKGDKIYYHGSFGYENFKTHDTLSTESSFQLASVSKTFTSTAVLYLVEKGLINLDDSLGVYFPNFPYRNIRVKELLSHRSGLPNYLHFCDAMWSQSRGYMSNDDLIDIMYKHPYIKGTYRPNTRFEYNNTNYALLASIVEKASGVRFPEFMMTTFFRPLGMKSSFVYDMKAEQNPEHAISYLANGVQHEETPYDGIYGDKGIYSSTEDMYRWNLAYYQNELISPQMQREAYSPRSFERPGVRNYGYGWRLMKQPDNSYLVYHNGWWHGNNTVFYRSIQDSFALIILSNRYNRSVYNVQPIFNLINSASTSADTAVFIGGEE